MSTTKPGYRKTAPAARDFVSKQIAAARLGLSVRRVLELSARGAIERRHVMDPATKRRQTVFLAADVERVAQATVNHDVALYRHPGAAIAREVAALPPVEAAVAAPPPPPDRRWLTVDEAAAYSGLPASFLLSLIAKRRLPALDVGVRPGGRYRVGRSDVDAIRAPGASRLR